MSTNLDLWRHLSTDSDADLDIGATLDALFVVGSLAAQLLPADADIDGRITLPASLCGQLRVTGGLTATVVLPGLMAAHTSVQPALSASLVFVGAVATRLNESECRGSAAYDINVYRDPSAEGGSTWMTEAMALSMETALLDSAAARLTAGKETGWQTGDVLSTDASGYQSGLPRSDQVAVVTHEQGTAISTGMQQPVNQLGQMQSAPALQHANGISLSRISGTAFNTVLPRLHLATTVNWVECGPLLDVSLDNQLLIKGLRIVRDHAGRYEEAVWPLPGVHTWPPVDPEVPVSAVVNLNFSRCRDGDTDLEFWYQDNSAIIIPIRGVYVVINSAVFYRARDGREIPVTDLTVDGDCDSWAWQFSATLPRIADASAVDGEEVVIVINGHESRHIVDGWSDNLAWGQQSATLTGRSLSAELSSSLALSRSYTEANQRTMSQLAIQELPTGWTLEWTAADWLVPAGAWSYSNLAPIDVISQLAEAAGAFILPDLTRRHLTIVSRYPVKPWGLRENDVQLVIPQSITITRGRQLTRGQNADAVWLSSPAGHLQTLVRKSGTAGSSQLADVSNQLITDTSGAQALGIALLAASMDKSIDTLELPISADTGLILPGRIIQTSDGIGYSRSLRQSARINDRKLVVRQSIELERQR